MNTIGSIRRWLVLLVLALAAGGAFAQGAAPPFDHLRTGFALTGEHARVRCESCHLNGVFKGTPRDCASCHLSGMRFARSNVVMPPQHPPTQASCDTCHTTTTFVGAKFSHAGVAAGTCQTCHNGKVAPGRSAQHMPTGSAQSCDDCHKSTSAWRPTAWNHTQLAVAGQCASCHSGAYPPADGRPANHVPYQTIASIASANCDSCHKGSYASWANGRVHANVSVAGGCANCHNGNFLNAVGKPSTPIHTGVTNCESCHASTGTWSGAKVDHGSYNESTNCAQCHGTSASGKPAGHIPTTANCFTCHNVAPAKWTPTKWNHTQLPVTSQCASCHTGGYPPADGRPTNHIPYQTVTVSATANCDGCHKGSYTTWANGLFHSNYSVSTGCFSCHTGAYQNAVGKPNTATHATVTGNCESCHKSTTSWAAASVDHSTFGAATNCSQCHGVSASGKPATHIPTTANCFTCHNVAPAKWTPTKWNHTQVPVTGQCATCHTGGYPPADGKPTNHIPYQTVPVTATANCDACHKGSYATWANGLFHSNFSVSTGCFSCHTGAYLNAVGKPNTATHATVTGNCESCHKSTTSWASATVDHSTFTAATNCSQCHGVSASGKPATHIPTTANCFTCHNVAPAKWTPTKWNHTQVPVTGQCASCHTGGYPPADGKPTNHIPYQIVAVSATANCDGCHKGSYTTWANGAFHANYSVASGCFSCHTGAYQNAVGKPNTATHATVTGNCESCHKSTTSWASATVDHSTFTAATNCSQCHGVSASGKPATHIPTTANCFTCHNVAPAKWTPTKWNHTQVPVTGQCASCHTGGYPPADGKPANHIPYQTVPVTATANCDGCHKGSFTTWANGRFHSNYSVTTGCFSCHTGAYLNAVGKPNTATHATVTGNCESCHKSTTSWASATVDHSTFTAATNCSQCHGVSASGKPATHIPTTANCFTCHNVAPAKWTPTKWNHTQVPVTGQCASCHTGGYPPADGKPTNHIPYQIVAVTATANCDGCHRGSFTTWANGKLHTYYTVTTGCRSCHTGAYLNARGKPSNHIPEVQLLNGASMECNACHTSTTSWSSMTMNHNGSQGSGAGWCKACHQSGTAWLGSMERMSLTHRSTSAIDCSQSGCHRPLGTKGTTYIKWD